MLLFQLEAQVTHISGYFQSPDQSFLLPNQSNPFKNDLNPVLGSAFFIKAKKTARRCQASCLCDAARQ
jgi:hypothetical protein